MRRRAPGGFMFGVILSWGFKKIEVFFSLCVFLCVLFKADQTAVMEGDVYGYMCKRNKFMWIFVFY